MLQLNVVVGVMINDKHEVYCVQRTRESQFPLKWEFPGGKIEKDESPKEALERELFEELAIKIEIHDEIVKCKYQYTDYKVNLVFYHVKKGDGQMKLSKHIQGRWVHYSQLRRLTWLEANNEVISLIETKQAVFT